MRHLTLSLVAAAALFGIPGRTSAGFLATATFQTTTSGTFAGTAFANALITFTGTYDTDAVTVTALQGGFEWTAPLSLGVDVAGVGSGHFLSTGGIVSYTVGSTTTLGMMGPDGFVLDTFNAAFANYDLRSSTGPVNAGFPLFAARLIHTTAGDLSLPSAEGARWTDQVTVAPAPTGLALAGLGALCLAGYAWRRRGAAV